MPRRLRVSSGGYAYHVLNRAVGRMRIFAKERDFEAFEEVIGQAKIRLPMRVLAWCVSWVPGTRTDIGAIEKMQAYPTIHNWCLSPDDLRWRAALRLVKPRGSSGRQSDWACNPHYVLAVARASHRLLSYFKTPDPF